MTEQKHKYRVGVYLGKETYEKIAELAKWMNIPIATMTRVILETGLQISKSMEKEAAKNVSE
jgi:hypothetical protein